MPAIAMSVHVSVWTSFFFIKRRLLCMISRQKCISKMNNILLFTSVSSSFSTSFPIFKMRMLNQVEWAPVIGVEAVFGTFVPSLFARRTKGCVKGGKYVNKPKHYQNIETYAPVCQNIGLKNLFFDPFLTPFLTPGGKILTIFCDFHNFLVHNKRKFRFRRLLSTTKLEQNSCVFLFW